MANTINSIKLGSTQGVISLPYGVCSTAAGTAAKTVTVDSFSLETGATVTVKFSNANTASSPTLNVNSTGAKAIERYGTTPIGTNSAVSGWAAGAVITFTYDGTNWIRQYWDNTQYSFNGAISTVKDSNLTASRALISNNSGKIAVSDITSTELSYLDNVSSNIQTQLNAKAPESSWTAKIQGQIWSRLCFVNYAANVVGCSFILNVGATRNSVVYNDTYIIHANHSKQGAIVKLLGTQYTNGIQIRTVSNASGSCYVELKDSANNIASGTEQSVYCRLVAVYTGTVTPYTTFTTGETIPDDFIISATLTTTKNNIQGTFEGTLTGSATKLGTSTIGSSIKPIYLSAGTPYASSETVGSAAKPIYLNSGTLTACSSTIGATNKPVYMNSGTITAFSTTIGSSVQPVYMNAGVITACSNNFSQYLPLTGGTVSGKTTFSNTTASTSMSTGAVVLSGGLGVAGQVSSNKIKIGNAVTLEYNSSTKSLDFIFD